VTGAGVEASADRGIETLMSNTASPIFTIPCPTCADELIPAATHEYRCRACGGRYRMNVGYLEPVGTSTPAEGS
jgi:hypothetical protein